MTSIDIALRDRYGLHPRAAMRIQQAAGRFRSRVTIRGQAGQGAEVDARSMISLVGAGIGPSEIVRLTADGEDEADALAALRDLLAAGVCHP
jgi:phosphocarrier protein